MNPPSDQYDPNEGFGAIAWGVVCLLLAIIVGLVVALNGGDEAPEAAAAPTPPNPNDPDAQTITEAQRKAAMERAADAPADAPTAVKP